MLGGCASTEGEIADAAVTADITVISDSGDICGDPSADYDGDGIPNGVEGCLTGRDSEGDKTPDWQDSDSDDDGVPDSVEAGKKDSAGKCVSTGKKWPCDTDGDGLPDYLDLDADGDGLKDGEEDENGDGLLGCCITVCNKPGSTQAKKCTLTTDGCGSGQKCTAGKCAPSISFNCSEGETSPLKKDTFGDGIFDSKRGTFICRDATESSPGRKPVQLRSDKAGDWHVALEKDAKYGALKITGASANMAAASINHDKATAEVAGFIVSRAAGSNIQTELSSILNTLSANPPGSGGTITVQASGSQSKSHDRYDLLEGTLLSLTGGSSADVSTVRNDLMARLLGKTTAELGNLSPVFGSSSSAFTIRFSMVRRFDFKKDTAGKLVLDAKGYPTDNGDSSKWRLVIMGAVASTKNYQDPKRSTGILTDDLSNGTALALASDKVGNECDVATIDKIPKADILWVSDESGSMNNNRDDVVKHAADFFKRALAMGLDFRMGITNVVPKGQTGYGKFCSQASTNKNDTGGVDRFLLPTEQTAFISCIRNPPGYTGGHSPGEYGLINAKAALTGHLPRSASDPGKFRKDAFIIIIVLTDQIAAAVESAVGSGYANKCQLPSTIQASTNTLLQPFISLFSGSLDPEAIISKFLVIGGVCNNSCKAMIAHGYNELVKLFGGQIGDVCQKNLGSTMQVFLDSIVAGASPITLDYVPISSSMAVSVDGTVVSRSRTNGFDYRTANNSLILISTKYGKGSRVLASYKRWDRQLAIK